MFPDLERIYDPDDTILSVFWEAIDVYNEAKAENVDEAVAKVKIENPDILRFIRFDQPGLQMLRFEQLLIYARPFPLRELTIIRRGLPTGAAIVPQLSDGHCFFRAIDCLQGKLDYAMEPVPASVKAIRKDIWDYNFSRANRRAQLEKHFAAVGTATGFFWVWRPHHDL